MIPDDSFRTKIEKLNQWMRRGIAPEQAYLAVSARDDFWRDIPKPLFILEYYALMMAFGCILWEAYCRDMKISAESGQKALFRSVFREFSSQKVMNTAQAFSAYLHAEGTDNESVAVISLMQVFFKRIGWESLLNPDRGKESIPPAVQNIVMLLEGFKNTWQEEAQTIFSEGP